MQTQNLCQLRQAVIWQQQSCYYVSLISLLLTIYTSTSWTEHLESAVNTSHRVTLQIITYTLNTNITGNPLAHWIYSLDLHHTLVFCAQTYKVKTAAWMGYIFITCFTAVDEESHT